MRALHYSQDSLAMGTRYYYDIDSVYAAVITVGRRNFNLALGTFH